MEIKNSSGARKSDLEDWERILLFVERTTPLAENILERWRAIEHGEKQEDSQLQKMTVARMEGLARTLGVIQAGGTGKYARALLKTCAEINESLPDLEAEIEKARVAIQIDPAAASAIIENLEKIARKMDVVGAECSDTIPEYAMALGEYPFELVACAELATICETEASGDIVKAREKYKAAKARWENRRTPEWLYPFAPKAEKF